MIRALSVVVVSLSAMTACATGDGPNGASVVQEVAAAPKIAVPTWQPLTHSPPPFTDGAGATLLLTDGTVMVQDWGTSDWWRLTPDENGSYRNGTWSRRASMPVGYSPLYFASAVLSDGRVIVEGGEYIDLTPVWSNLGAIYDPQADTWTPIAPPAGWDTIGDAQSVVLTDGTFMLANCCTTEAALFDPFTLRWTATGTGKQDINDEEGWTLLPDGTVLTVDANNTENLTQTERYIPATRHSAAAWIDAGQTPAPLADIEEDGSGSDELGPMIQRNDGTVIAFGATGHNAVYDSLTRTWSAAPDFPVTDGAQIDSADGPAALLPNGNILVVASPGVFNPSSHYFEFDGHQLNEVVGPPNAPFNSSFHQAMLVLPTGEILLTDFSSDVEIYTATGETGPGIAPEIQLVSRTLSAGNSYLLRGQRLNGLSQGAAYGDDFQMATNYPLVRITNKATGHVVYARTHNHSTMGIRNTSSLTNFDVPMGIEPGPSTLVVIANGNASAPVDVTVQP